MEINITGKNIEVTPELQSYIERKLSKLNRHLPNITEMEVDISKEKTKSPQDRYVVQATINSNGTLLRCEERGPDQETVVDKVAEVMNRQIERFKGKRYHKGRGNPQAKGKFSIEDESEQRRPKVVRTKRFVIRRMTPDDAIDQVELLGHTFFLFHSSSSDKISLLYKRNDGDYGIIEPEL